MPERNARSASGPRMTTDIWLLASPRASVHKVDIKEAVWQSAAPEMVETVSGVGGCFFAGVLRAGTTGVHGTGGTDGETAASTILSRRHDRVGADPGDGDPLHGARGEPVRQPRISAAMELGGVGDP